MHLLLAIVSIAQSVVLISTSVEAGAKSGTGFAIASNATDTRILTAAHVIEGSTAPLVFVGGPHGDRYTASILEMDPLRDIALLDIQRGNMPTVAIGSASPISGTAVQVYGYPTLGSRPASNPNATPAPLPLSALQLVQLTGKADGESEEGESMLLAVPLTHGDSGAPVVDAATNQVTGMVLGLAAGYGVASWLTGDALALSVAGINAFLAQSSPPSAPPKPEFAVSLAPAGDSAITASWPHLAASAGFVIADPSGSDRCHDLKGMATATAIVDEELYDDRSVLELDVTDCSGASFYRDTILSDPKTLPDDLRLINRSLLGYVDTHRPEWTSLLQYGVAVDPKRNPYLALITLDRNPFGQLMVAHVFRGGPGDAVGLHVGDAILKINGRPTRALADRFIAQLLDQPSVTLTASRSENEFTVRLKLRRFSAMVAKGPLVR